MPNELMIDRVIAAPRDAVWRAWTEHLDEWFCPAPWRVAESEVEWRAGGIFRTVMEGPAGERVDEGAGVILEIVPGERIVFTDALTPDWRPRGPFMVATIELADAGEGTRYTATCRHWTEEACAQHEAMGFHAGWGAAADQLERVAQRIAAQ
ncbi:SRPBCC family protein [Sphingomonas baiyangensis]|uniref:Activator of Hsp90 ATPase homologue 1/2-like C-terminal domain-containing protein n=1 Tax=Sphingomonas baiyangensis TaxID=2572576 RepID=A0A4V5PUF9_9SPHN|nr:SRPBCC family protein [Sphingomonas baiyangensis]TKD53298.1 hypothetical protein FBR43_02970 [Sphingomonas baiyangensis]